MPSSALARAPASAIQPAERRYDWLEILRDLTNGQRELLLQQGVAPPLPDLAGWEFGGANSPPIFRWLGIRKFCKGFYEGPPRSRAAGPSPFIQGYNVPVDGNRDDEPHVLRPSREAPKRFGFYRVHRVVEGARDDYYPNALLLDYSLGGNGVFGPPLRDYLVQVYPDNPDLLLGKAYLNILGLRIPTNYFVLKRLHPHAFRGD